MSENRSQEEYRDPDYSQFRPSRSQADANDNKISPENKPNSVKSQESRKEAICRIIEREFQRELISKEDELHEINKRIDDAKQLLVDVRYAVVHHYYNRKTLLYPDEEIGAVEKAQQESLTSYPPPGDKPQLAIHPSLKKLLGKRPIDYNEILKVRPTRKAAQNATEQFQKLAKKPANTKLRMTENIVTPEISQEIECKKPRYIGPSTSRETIPQMNSARGRNTYRHLLAVGNISKYIGDEEAGLATNVTHKWLVYISAKTAVPVEHIVSRARFFLHESYKPNDIVEVSAPPFQISKRGWGEFPIRVQLYFHAHLIQKPLQIFHTLVLDKKHTGLQTMGAETIVELWLNIPNTVESEEILSSSSDLSKTVPLSEPSSSSSSASYHPIPSTSSQALSKSIENPTPSNSLAQNSPLVKQEPIDFVHPSANTVATHDSHINGHEITQTPSISTPVVMKTETPVNIPTEQPAVPFKLPTAMPKLKICDQNNANASNLAGKPMTNVLLPERGSTRKTFVKCVGKDGKVSLMELVQDEKNPKLFKMVMPQGVQGNKLTLQAHSTNRISTPIILNPSNIMKPATTTANSVVQPVKTGVSIVSPAATTPGKPTSATTTFAIKIPNTANVRQMHLSTAKPIFINSNSNLKPLISTFKSPITTITSTSATFTRSNQPVQSPNQFVTTAIQSVSKSALPKLVAINSTVPSIPLNRPLQQMVALTKPVMTFKPAPVSTAGLPAAFSSATRIIQKNSKILVLDHNRAPKNQQSLLKPQVSLLKQRNSPATVNSRNLKRITVSNIAGIEHKNINVFVPADVQFGARVTAKSQNVHPIRQRYSDEVEHRFMARRAFSSMTEAIGWLLKEVTLVSPAAAQPEFRESLPFVLPTLDNFHRLHPAKQRSFEWLRAKYVNRLVTKHMALKNLPKWSTKDVLLFGRWFGYTPPSVFNMLKNSSRTKLENDQNLRDMVKSQLMKEHLQNDVISFNTKVLEWVAGVEENTTKCQKQTSDEKIIVVDDDDDDDDSNNKSTSPMKASNNSLQLPIQSGLDEIMWINEICRRTQIRFHPEEIEKGVLHRSGEVVFATALRCFVEDLLRKCYGNKLRSTDDQNSNTEINNDDVLRTISTIPNFDFLTNKNLGIDKTSN